MSRGVWLKRCLDEIDNTIKTVLVWMSHYHTSRFRWSFQVLLWAFWRKKSTITKGWVENVFLLKCAGRPGHHQICAGGLHFSPVSSGPAFFIYIETRSSLEQRCTRIDRIFCPPSLPAFILYMDWDNSQNYLCMIFQKIYSCMAVEILKQDVFEIGICFHLLLFKWVSVGEMNLNLGSIFHYDL